MVDELYQQLPDLTQDHYWDQVQFRLPHTEASAVHSINASNIDVGSAEHVVCVIT
jgi:hypothetical protein